MNKDLDLRINLILKLATNEKCKVSMLLNIYTNLNTDRMGKRNSVVERLRKRIPLETKLKVALQVEDIDNWDNGTYSGNAEMYLDTILKTIETHEREHGIDASASILTLHDVIDTVCPKCGCNKFTKVDSEYWCLNKNCEHEWQTGL